MVQNGFSALEALITLAVGLIVARMVAGAAVKLMRRSKVEEILVSFGGNFLRWLLMAAVLIAALQQVGFQTTSLIAVMGAAGLAVALALQSQMSNLAAGVLLLIFRPFKLGDFIDGAGALGVVKAIQLLNTELKTPDGKAVIIPNSKLVGGNITDLSAYDIRRIDLVMSIGYDDDIKKAKDLLEEILAAEARVLKDPAPSVVVMELADSSVNFAVRPWVKKDDWWAVRCALMRRAFPSPIPRPMSISTRIQPPLTATANS